MFHEDSDQINHNNVFKSVTVCRQLAVDIIYTLGGQKSLSPIEWRYRPYNSVRTNVSVHTISQDTVFSPSRFLFRNEPPFYSRVDPHFLLNYIHLITIIIAGITPICTNEQSVVSVFWNITAGLSRKYEQMTTMANNWRTVKDNPHIHMGNRYLVAKMT